MALHHREIAFIRHFSGRYDLADRQMAAAVPNGVKFHDLYGIAHDVGAFFRIPAAVLMLMLALVCMVRAAPSRYRRSFDLDSLIREQAASFRTTAAFVGRRLRLVPPSPAPRPADYALTPEEWIARFATRRDGGFGAAAARQALALQLGPPWRGVEHASPAWRPASSPGSSWSTVAFGMRCTRSASRPRGSAATCIRTRGSRRRARAITGPLSG